MNKTTPWVAVAMALCLPALARAQSGPADPGTPVPAIRYESAFADYQPWQDVSAGDWRAANQAVGAPAAAPASAAASAVARQAAPAGHEGHRPPGAAR